MAEYKVIDPSGKERVISGPDGATDEQIIAEAKKLFSKPEEPKPPQKPFGIQPMANFGAGLIRGAGSIGATLLAPIDIAKDAMEGKGLSLESNRARRKAMDDAFAGIGVETDSFGYGGGKLAGEIAGTAGVGPALAGVKGVATVAPNFANALRTSGMTSGGGNVIRDMLTRSAGAGVTGAVSAGLVDPEQAKTGGIVGAATPGVVKALGKAGQVTGQALRKTVSDDVAALARRAQDLGIEIPADRLVDSRPMNAVASALNYIPFSGRATAESRMNSQLNQALSRTFGQNSSNVTQALRKADQVLGGEFERVLSTNGVKVDKQMLTDIADVFNKAERELGSDALKPIASKVDELMEKASTGVIDGRAAYNIKRDLDRLGGSRQPNAWHAIELKKKLMDALDRSLGPAEAAKFAKTREQYGNMLDLEKIAKNGAEGEISAARLANMKNINNQPLQELADIAAQFVKSREGMHGAAQRAATAVIGSAMAGPAAVATAGALGRGANSMLSSNALRNAMIGGTSQNALWDLLSRPDVQQQLGRAVPVISAQ